MKVWRDLWIECIGLLSDWIVGAAVLRAIDAGVWLRNHHLLPDLWFRARATRLVMWPADRWTR